MSERKERLEAIFQEAVELGSPDQQEVYLDRACAGDPELRCEVKDLLHAALAAEAVFENRATARFTDSTVRMTPVLEQVGSLIGRYKLLEKIGEGGMGVVYMAEQEEPVRRRVALKIIKLGMDTKSVAARFEAERQALALMDHPNIAKVLDGGATDTGRPYFVMELVQGVPITEFCDKNRLDAQERIKLFIQVCQAIQSAHQKGIIHRDLKPTNILVTLNPDGSRHPMVIDFGVAKATQQKLTEKTVFTNFATMIGTPAYMSPEQAEMSRLDVDTRSDIYGLGVLLYELLTGTTPFPEKRLRSVGYSEMQRIILEEEPERPSTRLSTLTGEQRTILARNRGATDLTGGNRGNGGKRFGIFSRNCWGTELTEGNEGNDGTRFRIVATNRRASRVIADDLDWIVMKCLEKDRDRRYETANGLAADLKRHLDNEPVVARPPSTAYRLQKAIRRNKLAFTAGAAIAAALVVSTSISTWQAVVATRANTKALAAQTEAKQAQESETSIRREAEHQLYIAEMNLAQQAWEQNNMEQLPQLLKDTQDSPYRGFEWYFWQPKTHLASKTLQRHLDVVYSVALSADGGRMVTASWDGTAKVWDAGSAQELLTLKGHNNYVYSAAFSPDGRRIVTGSLDHTAKVWDASSGRELFTLRGHSEWVPSVAFSPDGRRIATGSGDHTARVWDAASGRFLRAFEGARQAIMSVAFSPDSKRIVAGSMDQRVRVWDADIGKELVTLTGHNGGVYAVAFSPDGHRILTGSWDKTAKVWDAANGNDLLTLRGHSGWVLSAAFSGDGRRIVTGSQDRTAKVWDAASGEELLTFRGHRDRIFSVAFFPNGQRIVTASADRTVKVWETTNGVSADKVGGNLLTLKGATGTITSMALSPDGGRIVTGSEDHTAKVWEAASGKELVTLKGHSNEIWSVAFSSDGQRIVTGCYDHTAKVWDAASGTNLVTLNGHSDWLLCVAFSLDGRRIVTGSRDDTARVWDATSGHELCTLRGHLDSILFVAFSPDGKRILTGSGDKTAKVWDAASGTNLLTLRGHMAPVFSVVFSPDGRRILTGSDDNTAKVWDAANGTNLLTLKGHSDAIFSVAFSPDGWRIVTGSCDQTAKVWEAATGRDLLTLKGHTEAVVSVGFSLDGQRIVTGSLDGTVKVWEAATVKQVTAWQEEDRVADQYVAALRQQPEIDNKLKQDAFNRAKSGRWAEAATCLTRAIEHNPNDHELWYWLGAIYVQTGQLDAYREHCRKALERFSQATDPYTAESIAKDCLILPGSGANLDTLSKMADTAVAQGQNSPGLPWYEFCKGLAEYRQGRFPSAADWMGTVLTNSGSFLARDAEACVVLAMSQCQLQQIEQAHASLAKGAEIEQASPKLESGDVGDDWMDWIIAHALMREAKAMIESQRATTGPISPAPRD